MPVDIAVWSAAAGDREQELRRVDTDALTVLVRGAVAATAAGESGYSGA
ncbi:MAG: hypothetical protein JWP62_2521 [Blastococcus sp.]|jgi:hypothetical protein|nr:hypothetical protein [Blastococcus sp.]